MDNIPYGDFLYVSKCSLLFFKTIHITNLVVEEQFWIPVNLQNSEFIKGKILKLKRNLFLK